MDIKILTEEEIPLLARKKVILEISYPKSNTPSKAVVKKTIANLLKIKEELIALKHIYPKFGQGKAKIIANVYKNLKDLKAIEEIKKKAKTKKKEKVAEKKAEEAKAKEEVKEEAKEKPSEETKEKPTEKPEEKKEPEKESKEEAKESK